MYRRRKYQLKRTGTRSCILNTGHCSVWHIKKHFMKIIVWLTEWINPSFTCFPKWQVSEDNRLADWSPPCWCLFAQCLFTREKTHITAKLSLWIKKKKKNQTNIVHSAYELLLGILKVKPGAIRLIPSFLSSVMNPEKVTDPGFVVWNLYSLYRWVAIELHHSDFPSRETAAGILVGWQPPTAAPLSPLWHPYHGLASLWLF